MDLRGWESVACSLGPLEGNSQEGAEHSDQLAVEGETTVVQQQPANYGGWQALAFHVPVASGEEVTVVGADSSNELGGTDPPIGGKRKRGRPPKRLVAVSDERGEPSCVVQPCEGHMPHVTMQLGLVGHSTEQASTALVRQLAEHAVAKVPSLHSLERNRFHGHCAAPVTSAALIFAALHASEHPEEIDDDYMKLASHYLHNPAAFHCASVVSRSSYLDISDKVFETKLCRLAAAHLCYNRVCRLWLEERVCQMLSKPQLLGYCEFMAFDETPLMVGMKETMPDVVVDHDSDLQANGVQDARAIQKMSSMLRSQAVIGKLLQCHQGFGMVLDIGSTLGFVKVIGMHACPLQVLERNSSDVLSVALGKQSNSSQWSDEFQFKVFATAKDKGSSNLKAEKQFLDKMSVPWSHLPLFCEVHVTANIFGSVYDGFFNTAVTGLINTGLSLRLAGALACFRRCLREVIQESLEFKRGKPSDDAQEYKRLVMNAFVSPKSKNVSQLLLLSMLPNGDWRSTKVEHYVAHDVQVEEYAQIAANIEYGLIQALVCKRPQIFCRHRWGGCEVALEEMGLLESVHQLLSRSYKRFVVKCNTAKASKQLFTADTHGDANTNIDIDQEMPSTYMPISNQEGLESESFAGTSAASLGANRDTGGNTTDEASNFAAQNDAQRRKAMAWLQTSPVDTMLIMRLTMMPLLSLLHRQFQVCGQDWERQQQVAAIQKLQAGSVEGSLARDYMITLACEGVLEKEFAENLSKVAKESQNWLVIKDHNINAEVNHLIFKMLSRAGCLVETKLCQPHRLFPYKTFKLLKDPGYVSELKKSTSCMFDPFTTDLIKVCPGFEGQRCLQLLHLAANLGWTSIARLESLHSSVRRQAVLRSAQTHAFQAPFLSAEFLMQKLRRAGVDIKHGQKRRADAQPARRKVTFVHLLPLNCSVLVLAKD
eukprot:4447366-Amphidinium_carterae.2